MEDALFLLASSLRAGKEAGGARDVKMAVHHAVTAALCLGSVYTGYTRIGALVWLAHDASDVPLDVVRAAGLLGWTTVQTTAYVATLVSWVGWRLAFFPLVVLRSVAADSKSLLYPSPCEVGACTLAEVPERIPFLALLGTLAILHWAWFWLLLQKGYRELTGGGGAREPKADRDV